MSTPPRLAPAEYLASLTRDIGRYADVLTRADLDAAVPGCPGWTLTNLTRHLGTVHRWASERVRTGEPAARGESPTVEGELLPWFVEGGAALVAILGEADPQRPCWSFGPPSTVAFWLRRQAQETAVHLWDAGSSQGLDLDLAAALAADGVAEVAEVFVPRQRDLERLDPIPVTLRMDMAEGSVVIPADVSGSDVVTLSGPADRVLLALWGRLPLDAVTVDGDVAAARAALAAHLTS